MSLRRARVLTPKDLGGLHLCAGLDADDAWAREACDRWGLCGVALASDTWLLLCPPQALPAQHPLHGHMEDAESRDHAVLLALQVAPGVRRSGLGRLLVQAAAARLHGQAPVIEAAGSRAAATACCPPSAWLQRVGFVPVPRFELLAGGAQRLQLNLDRTVTWRPRRVSRPLRRFARWLPGVWGPAEQPGWQTPRDATTDPEADQARWTP